MNSRAWDACAAYFFNHFLEVNVYRAYLRYLSKNFASMAFLHMNFGRLFVNVNITFCIHFPKLICFQCICIGYKLKSHRKMYLDMVLTNDNRSIINDTTQQKPNTYQRYSSVHRCYPRSHSHHRMSNAH